MTRELHHAPGAGIDAAGLVVETDSGAVRGVRRNGVRRWRGIPYAASTAGDRRFRAPLPAPGWDGVRDASTYGPVAPQNRKGQFIGASPRLPRSEDCLSVNVVAPDESDVPAGGRPVMVFLHGGAYSVGSSGEYPQQGERLVRRHGVVYVSLNYRLGALGWLDFRAYASPGHPFECNLGLRDQVAALEWVRRNIRAFGGDPGQRDALRRVVGRELRDDAADGAGGRGALRAGDRAELTRERGLPAGGRGEVGGRVRAARSAASSTTTTSTASHPRMPRRCCARPTRSCSPRRRRRSACALPTRIPARSASRR